MRLGKTDCRRRSRSRDRSYSPNFISHTSLALLRISIYMGNRVLAVAPTSIETKRVSAFFHPAPLKAPRQVVNNDFDHACFRPRRFKADYSECLTNRSPRIICTYYRDLYFSRGLVMGVGGGVAGAGGWW
jgi:hypothetical protein